MTPTPARRLDEVQPPIARKRLADEVALRIRRFVVDEGLSPGDRLPSERQLAERLGTSRATVSQALRSLSVSGLLVVRHGSGIYLQTDPARLVGITVDLSIGEDRVAEEEIAEFIHWIERALVRADPAPEFDVEAIDAAFGELETAGGSIGEFVQADADFHRTVIEATGNRYLVALFTELHREVHRLTYAGWIESGTTPGWLEGEAFTRQIQLHRRIRDATAEFDLEGLAVALEAHRQAVTDHLRRR